ncbi:hypothetical protein SAMN05192544_102665 [Paraburkholderia hospita]|nr:hypothetical protein SAMN05192544_102665 [Paraburkholderia hospita]
MIDFEPKYITFDCWGTLTNKRGPCAGRQCRSGFVHRDIRKRDFDRIGGRVHSRPPWQRYLIDR